MYFISRFCFCRLELFFINNKSLILVQFLKVQRELRLDFFVINVIPDRRDNGGIESWNFYCWEYFRNIRNFISNIIFNQISNSKEFISNVTLFINRCIIVVACNVSHIVSFTLSVCTSCQCKIRTSMNHILRERILVIKNIL